MTIEHPLVVKARKVLRPLNRARTGKRMVFFFVDKGVKGVPKNSQKCILVRYLRSSGIKAFNNGLVLSIQDSKRRWVGEILMNIALRIFVSRFDAGDFPHPTGEISSVGFAGCGSTYWQGPPDVAWQYV